MLRYQQQFPFFDPTRVNRSVRIINLSDAAREGDLDQALRRIVTEVEAHGPGLEFIDTFCSRVVASNAKGDWHFRLQNLLQLLGTLMTSWQATPR